MNGLPVSSSIAIHYNRYIYDLCKYLYIIDLEKSKVTRGLSQRRGTIHALKMKQDSLKQKGSVTFASDKTTTSPSALGYSTQASIVNDV